MLHVHHKDETQYTNYNPDLFVVCCSDCHDLLEKMQYRLKNNPDLLSEKMKEKWIKFLDEFIIL